MAPKRSFDAASPPHGDQAGPHGNQVDPDTASPWCDNSGSTRSITERIKRIRVESPSETLPTPQLPAPDPAAGAEEGRVRLPDGQEVVAMNVTLGALHRARQQRRPELVAQEAALEREALERRLR